MLAFLNIDDTSTWVVVTETAVGLIDSSGFWATLRTLLVPPQPTHSLSTVMMVLSALSEFPNVTDAVALPVGGAPSGALLGRDLRPIALLCAAEASPNTYDDGEVVGCRLAIWDADGLTSFDIQVQDSAGVASACTLKLEGIELLHASDDALVFAVVADMDDETQAAQIGQLTLPRRR